MHKSTIERKLMEVQDQWSTLSDDERIGYFTALPREQGEELFLVLPADEQARLIAGMALPNRRSWIRLLQPDDAADVIQHTDEKDRKELLEQIDQQTRNEVAALLVYAEDVAGGLMNPRFARLRPDMTADESIHYLQRQSREQAELIQYAYVIDPNQRLVGLISFRDLCHAKDPTQRIWQIMNTDYVAVLEQTDQEEISRLFSECDLMALPVVDADGHMKGIVTIDDIVDVVKEEATEDAQKVGGMEALDAPYMRTGLRPMIAKRGGWLLVLFLGEMLTATAMGYYEKELSKAIVLSLFLPLIISSGGNAGSQATTLVIRAMALGEIQMRDVWKVVGREIVIGLLLGLLLGVVGFFRVIIWETLGFTAYGAHYFALALTISFSLVGIVAWGTLTGAFLPFILRKCHVDPATASTPFVATMVDVTGLVIYFTTASIILRGTLL